MRSSTVKFALFLGPLSFSAVVLVGGVAARAETFFFGSGAAPIVGVTETTLAGGDFSLHVEAGPTGALLRKAEVAPGLGVSSAGIPGVTDAGGLSDFNILGGNLAGVGESVEFSFDRPGVLTGLNFDGLSDERLEFFALESASGLRINFVDSRASMPNNPHPIYVDPLQAALAAGAIVGDVVFLLEGGGFDDEVYGLEIPFVAGQEFTLTFGAAGLPYSQDSNFGALLQGIEVQPVPEPATAAMLVLACLTCRRLRRRCGARLHARS